MTSARVAALGSTAALHVVRASPFITVQDLGRAGHRHLGIPAGGAMDAWALQAANVLAGNAPGAAALEHALGAGTLRFGRDAAFALAGAECDARLNGEPVASHRTLHARAGDELALGAPRDGRFTYLAVAGGLLVPPVLGSAATYLPAAFGGLHGRRLQAGDVLPLGDAPREPRARACPPPLRAELGLAATDDAAIRVVRGPRTDALDDAARRALRALLDAEWTVSATADRTGYRLDGIPIDALDAGARGDAAARPSEPGCPGAVQLPPDGRPIVLMADAPTVGGYPRPAVVCGADLGRLAQRTPGARVRLAEITIAEAQRAHRRRRVAVWTLERL